VPEAFVEPVDNPRDVARRANRLARFATEEELSFLAERDLQGKIQFCQQCKDCLPTCPQNVDVPTLMRTYMYAAQYANFAHARQTLDDMPMGQSIFACGACTECTARCSNPINIGSRIDTLESMYVA